MSSAVETSPQTFLLSLPKALQVACRTAGTVKSVEEVVALTEEPKIFKLQKVDREATYKVVGRILLKMVKDMNLPNGLSSDNLRTIAKRLTDDEDVRYWLTLADISLLCRRVAEGYYGKTYGHFGLAEFNECLIAYCNERRDCHKQQNDKTVAAPNEAALTMKELGYSIGEDGQLQVPDEMKDRRLAQPLYLYDNYGKRVGINPKGAFGKKVNSDRVYNLAKAYMNENPDLDLDQAIEKAEAKLKQAQQ